MVCANCSVAEFSTVGLFNLYWGVHSKFAVEALMVPSPHSLKGGKFRFFDGAS